MYGGVAVPSFARASNRIAQRDRERLQPSLEMLPLIESVPIKRLAHLLGARRANAALGLVELQALRFEGKLAEIQQAAHIGLEILDEILMEHTKNPPGQH